MFTPYCLAFCFVAWISVCSGDDVVVQMFSKKPVNFISEKYISYSIDPIELLEMSREKEDAFVYRMMESGPSYLKIYGNNTNKMRLDGEFIDLNASKLSLERLKSVYDVLITAGIKPVIALPYDPKNWNTRNVMKILGKVSMLEMNDITWQLGADFHAKDAISYIDDLNTLKLIVGAFSTKTNKKNWSVVGSDITLGSSDDEARMYSEFSKYIVDAVGWSQSIDLSYADENVDDFFSGLNVDPALRTILNGESPVWLSLMQKNTDVKNPLTQMKQGLNWAQILGDAAKNGFKAIYAPINRQTWYEHSMTYYTTLLHKRIIGQTVFDTKMFNGNRFDSHFYAHCTKNISGSFTLFGVNAADSSLEITAKLPFLSGTEYLEFVLTVGVNGKVYLNGAEIIEPTVLIPEEKFKLPGKGAMISMPAHSVAFWVFTGASIPECASVEPISFEIEQTQERTSSELLLQQLIVETVAKDKNNAIPYNENSIKRSKRSANSGKDGMNNRIRRHAENNIDKHGEYNAIEMEEENAEPQARDKRFIGDGKIINHIYNEVDDIKRRNLIAPYTSKLRIPTKRMKRDINMLKNLFDKFDLKKSAFNFKTPTLKFGAKGLIPSISTVHDVLNAEPKEKKLFDQVENPELPTGDVHFELAAAVTEPNEYAAALNAANQIVERPPSDPFLDPYSNTGLAPPPVVTASLSNAVPSSVSLGELTELDVKSNIANIAPPPPPLPIPRPAPVQTVQPIQPAPPVQHQLQFIVKDLPPTWQVNRENMERARANLRQNLWPMATNAQSVNPKPITAFLPNVAVQAAEPDEHVLFESKRRRRRSIDSKINEEIEERVQRNAAKSTHDLHLDEAIDQVELLEKMLQLIDKLERSENTVLKNSLGIGKFSGRTMDETESSAPKKCKVLSMAMEQQCLQTETRPRALFKRAIEYTRTKPNGPLKKFFAKIKDTVERPMRFRTRRSANFDIDSEENLVNTIPKEFHEEVDYIIPHRKNVYNIRRNELKRGSDSTTTSTTTTITTTTTTTARPTSTSTTTSTTATQEPKTFTTTEKNVPKILRVMKTYMNKITNSIARHIGRMWLALS